MKKTFVLSILFIISHSLFSQIKTSQKKVETEINQVTVFLSGAIVKRVKKVQVEAGRTELVFTGLEGGINPGSILASVDKGGKLLSVSNKTDYINELKGNKTVQQIADSLTFVQDQINAITDELGAYHTEKKLMEGNMSLHGKDKGLTAFELKEVANLFRSRIKEINFSITALNKRKGKLDLLNVALSKELKGLKYKLNRPDNQILVTIDNPSKGEVQVILTYLIHSAAWAPKYDLRSEGVSSPIQIEYRGQVANRSGVDWENVNLVLSTNDPTLTAQKPTLTKWSIGSGSFNQQKLGRGYFNSNVVQSSMANSWALSDTTYKADDLQFVEITVSELTVEYKITERYSIPANGKPYLVDIREEFINAQYDYFAIPKEDKDAFLIAKIKDWERLNIIEGPANIYFKGTYVGQSSISTKYATNTLSLSMGRDNKVLIKRKKVEEFCSSKMIGLNKKETFAFETTIRNTSTDPIHIDVWDQIPVSTNSEVVVSPLSIEGANYGETDGSLQWSLEIPPLESKKILVSFSVKYPKKLKLNLKNNKKVYAPRF